MKIKGQLDQVSLKKFGVPENFEHLFDDVYQGEDGGIYALKEGDAEATNCMHLLSKNGVAYPIRNAPEIPADIAELHRKVYTPTNAGERLRIAVGAAYHKNENARLKYLIEKKYHRAIPGIAPDDYSFEESYEYCLFSKKFNAHCLGAIPIEKNGNTIKALFATGCLLIVRKDCYELIDFTPIFEGADGKTIFWAGGEELILAYLDSNQLYFCHLGSLMKFTQTEVSILIEVKNNDRYILYQLGETLKYVACAHFENGFKIDQSTGKVVCYSSYDCDGMVESAKTYIFEDGKYKEAQ